MSMRRYDHLFFDLDHTLWDFETNSRLAMQQTILELKLVSQIIDFEQFIHYYEQINSQLWELYRKQEIRKPALIRQRFEQTLSHFEIHGTDPMVMNEHYLKLMPQQKKLYPEVIETLEYLQQKGYQMHIITNGFTEVQHQKIESSGLSPYFQRVFISEAIQAPKPDKRIFQYALSSCNAKKNRSIMIGDSWESDIVGARNFGISQIFIDNTSSFPQKTNTPPLKNSFIKTSPPRNTTFAIKTIKELTQLL